MDRGQAFTTLAAVLCDHEGKCCIEGSDGDRQAVDEALRVLAEPDVDTQQELEATIEQRDALSRKVLYFETKLKLIRDSTFRNAVTLRGIADDALTGA